VSAYDRRLVHVQFDDHLQCLAMAREALLNTHRPRAATFVGLGVALLLPLLANLLVTYIAGATPSRVLITVGLANHWAMLALLLVIVIRWEREPLQSIGWRSPRWSTLPLGIVAGVTIAVVAGFVSQRLGLQSDTHFLAFLQSLPLVLRVALVITAGVFEETLYRGYGIERLSKYFGGK